ncbi:MAG: hypothetical protein AUJ12_00530 [Alphaproteobacteria bacterium CG1_02_46_17]|nr:MAG: hypothetical protein AUJ12_00530 [Alphaproteobacteria bacterium CG1_02_46_17]
MMIRILTLGTIITLSAFAVPAHAEEQENKADFQTGSFSTHGIESKAYAAFGDPAPFDPSSIEPAAGDENDADSSSDSQVNQTQDINSASAPVQE